MKNRVLLFDNDNVIEEVVEESLGKSFSLLKRQWMKSKFKRLRLTGGTTYTGDLGQLIVSLVYKNIGKEVYDVSGKPCGYDLIIDDIRRAEVKTAFLNKYNKFIFCQIRPFAKYENCIFCTITPDDNIKLHICSHADITVAKNKGFIKEQHDNRTKQGSGLFEFAGTTEDLENKIGAVDISYLLGDDLDSDIDNIIAEIEHNKNENRKHLVGTDIEPVLYSSSKICMAGLKATIKMYTDYGLSVTIKSFGTTYPVNGGGRLIVLRTATESAAGTFGAKQLRRYENYDSLNLLTFTADNDIHIMETSKEEVDIAIDAGRIGQLHNNYKNNGKTHLYGITGTMDKIKETLNMKEL